MEIRASFIHPHVVPKLYDKFLTFYFLWNTKSFWNAMQDVARHKRNGQIVLFSMFT